MPRKKPGMTTRDDTVADTDTDVATDGVDSIHDPMINDLVDENYGMIKVIIDGEEEMVRFLVKLTRGDEIADVTHTV